MSIQRINADINMCVLVYVFFLSQGNPSTRVAAASEAIVIGDKLNQQSQGHGTGVYLT